MGSAYPPGYEHLKDLLFVTTNAAKKKLGIDPANPTQPLPVNPVDHVETIVGNHLVVIPDNLTDVKGAAGHVSNILRDDGTIKGVVILGDYETVPSWMMMSISERWPAGCKNPDLSGDQDEWWVWSDDLYGDKYGDRLADVPVSRIPIACADFGILGDKQGSPVPGTWTPGQSIFGVRSTEFSFADPIYDAFRDANNPPGMKPSPPGSARPTANGAPDIGPADLATDGLYVVLHSSDGGSSFFNGVDSVANETRIAVDFDVVAGGVKHGIVFAGVCWGALIATSAKFVYEKEPLSPRTAKTSLALAFLDRGANAFVGFTALHWVPHKQEDGALGSPLHGYFWQRLANGEPPALALFGARKQYITEVLTKKCSTEVLARAMKTYWSATCIGLGW